MKKIRKRITLDRLKTSVNYIRWDENTIYTKLMKRALVHEIINDDNSYANGKWGREVGTLHAFK